MGYYLIGKGVTQLEIAVGARFGDRRDHRRAFHRLQTLQLRLREFARGLGYRNPLAGAALALAMFSLAGIPPTAGFMAKFAVFSAALRAGEISLALVGIAAALVAVFFYLRVVVVLYMKASAEPSEVRPLNIPEILALVLPSIAIILLGVYPQPLLDLIKIILM